MPDLGELVGLGMVLLVALAGGAIGVILGMFVLAPRVGRAVDRDDDDADEHE